MQLALSEDQQALVALVRGFLEKEVSPARVRAAEPLGFDAALFRSFDLLGLLELVRPLRHGGRAASLLDRALVAEQLGAALAPVPFAELAAALVAVEGVGGADLSFFDAADAHAQPALTLALRPARDGVFPLVPAGAIARRVVGLDGDALVVVGGSSAATSGSPSAPSQGALPGSPRNLGDAPLADRTARGSDRIVLAHGAEAHAAFERALDVWRVLSAATLSGLATRALEIGVAYATTREQFGVPIGSFQALAHRLADVSAAVEGARLLVREAAWAADEGERCASVLAAAAYRFAGEAAEQSAGESLHVHGGYGFTLEYDIQLFYRRAKAWSLALDVPARELRRLGRRVLACNHAPGRFGPAKSGARPGDAMDFRLGERSDRFRAEVRAFLAETVTDAMRGRAHSTGTYHDWTLHRALGQKGWIAAAWPRELGGQGRDPAEMAAFHEEAALAEAPIDGLLITMMVANTIRDVGSEAQRRELIPPMIRGESLVALGYSEPGAGSDVSAVRTRAVREGAGWRIDGEKVFTSLAHESQFIFLLARTSPDKPKRDGLTLFLVPVDTPGIEIRPIRTLGGERTNATYYRDVRVDDRYRIGEVDGGWKVLGVALTHERAGGSQEGTRVLAQFVDWARTARDDDGRPWLDDPGVLEAIGRAAIRNEVAYLLGRRASWLVERGEPASVASSTARLYYTTTFQDTCSELLDLVGPAGVLQHGEPGAPADGWLERAHRHAAVGTIYAGSSEIQRTIVARQGLRLPRAPGGDR
ncbi:MAG: acyl-CoA dehydrogenase family protein [Myxococcota bacterium]